MSVAIGPLGNFEIGNVFHHPVQAKNLNFNSYVYITCIYIINQIY